jgi:hypothetical protein
MAMGPAGSGTKNDHAGEGQQQFTRNTESRGRNWLIKVSCGGGGTQQDGYVVYTEHALSCGCQCVCDITVNI